VDTIPSLGPKPVIEAWQSLVHVCRRWRSIVFASPRHLNLRLLCTPETPVGDTLDIWPALPLLIRGDTTFSSGMDNIVIALGETNRVCQVSLEGLLGRQLEYVLAAMQVPFPELKLLHLSSYDEMRRPVVPDSFLGGSAPHLRTFELEGILFPGLPNLLSSATHLFHLDLSLPHSGYISPGAMADLLSMLSSLQTLALEFQSPLSRPDEESPPPSNRFVIPALKSFCFDGVIEYLEDLVTYFDAPQLHHLSITFFNQIDFDSPQLAQFISRAPKLADCDSDAHVGFDGSTANVRLPSHLRNFTILVEILCRGLVRQLSSLARACNTCPLSMIESLYVEHQYPHMVWEYDVIENTLWLELLLSFPAVKNLYLSKDFAPGIAAALQEISGTEELPSLQNIFVEGLEPSGPFQENIGQFVTARQLSGHPISFFVWDGCSTLM